jgi:hypothetical protein
MENQEPIKLKSKLIVFLMSVTILLFIMGLLAIFFGQAVQETTKMFQREEPLKLQAYSYFQIIVQTFLYAFLFFLPGFFIISAIYPKLPILERSVLSIALAVLLYAFYINVFIAIIKLQPFISGEIFWDLLYVAMLSVFGLIFWLLRLTALKNK